eukprot:CAMPEP_0170131574 /NCGR_PEP_ID=MMETSP0020_2-20130122/23342_1 /TAXON_ID=98059 /ORGANISM="Dinobryon sp., Strain UTEXLB2267" /LENGTH=118 /DNA_ID=CAMNT_0010366701 /DNA_START=17 /DNA_END=373 /DNA_ORIENTATION=-
MTMLWGPTCISSANHSTMLATPSCFTITPLGFPVDPDVYSTYASVSELGVTQTSSASIESFTVISCVRSIGDADASVSELGVTQTSSASIESFTVVSCVRSIGDAEKLISPVKESTII